MPSEVLILDGPTVVGETLTAEIVDMEPPSGDPFGTPTPVGSFYRGFPWRIIFTDLDSVVTTWAQGLQTNRTLSFSLGESATIEGALRPDDFRVNGIWTDGYPRVAQSNRLVFAFRREGSFGTPWIIRSSGVLMSPDDQGDADVPVSRFVAYDGRKLLEGRPAVNEDGALPGSQGFRLLSGSDFATGAEIALTFLKNTIDHAGTVRIDAGEDWGGTAFYAGTINATDPLDLNIQQGQSVADVWQAVEQAGNCDLILTPIYDPINRPGYTHELSIYRLAGEDRYDCVFAWDMLNRSLANIERMHDGTPGSFFNVVQWYAGQGGPPVPSTGPLENAASVTDFGEYWSQQFFPTLQTSIAAPNALLAMMRQTLDLVKQGKRTLTLTTVTERAKIPLRDYTFGDRVNVHASKRLRVTADGLQRVQTIPIQISDDGIETVPGLLTSPDYRTLGT